MRYKVLKPCTHYVLAFLCISFLLIGCTNPVSTNPIEQSTKLPTATPNVVATATQTVLDTEKKRIWQIIQGMTLDEKIGQLIMVEYDTAIVRDVAGNPTVSALYEKTHISSMLTEHHVGGFLIQPVNGNTTQPYDNVETFKNDFVGKMKADAKIPLLLAVDQEGGQVNKFANFYGVAPSAEEMAATGSVEQVEAQGKQAAQWIKDAGLNTNLAPLADVNTIISPTIPLLRDRTFGTDPVTVSKYAGAFLNGLQKEKVIGTLKQFPGLGSFNKDQDPHDGLFKTPHSLEESYTYDIAPFRELIKNNNPAMIMTTNYMLPSIDSELPAELSPKMVDGILRKELGYKGVIITDGLYMGGIAQEWTIGEAAVLAIVAGNDMIEGPTNPDKVSEVQTAIKQAMNQGKITEARIEQSVERILLMKLRYGILE